MTSLNLGPRDSIASFDVDPQNTFTPVCPDELPVPDGHSIVQELNAQAALASKRVASKDAHHPSAIWVANDEHAVFSPVCGEHVDIRWPVHAIPGTIGFDLLAGLPKVTEYDYFVWKGIELDMHPYGACYHDMAAKLSTGVIEFFKIHSISTVIVGGLALDYCVKQTVLELCAAGFQVVVNLGACRGVSPETSAQAMNRMLEAGAQYVESANNLRN